jgi:hypothetical protein
MIPLTLTLIRFALRPYQPLSVAFTAAKNTTATGLSGVWNPIAMADLTAFGAAPLKTAMAGVLVSTSFPSIRIIETRTATKCGRTMRKKAAAIRQIDRKRCRFRGILHMRKPVKTYRIPAQNRDSSKRDRGDANPLHTIHSP